MHLRKAAEATPNPGVSALLGLEAELEQKGLSADEIADACEKRRKALLAKGPSDKADKADEKKKKSPSRRKS